MTACTLGTVVVYLCSSRLSTVSFYQSLITIARGRQSTTCSTVGRKMRCSSPRDRVNHQAEAGHRVASALAPSFFGSWRENQRQPRQSKPTVLIYCHNLCLLMLTPSKPINPSKAWLACSAHLRISRRAPATLCAVLPHTCTVPVPVRTCTSSVYRHM